MDFMPKRLSILIAYSAFITTIVVAIFIDAPIQQYFGMTGLAITEILILANALLFAIIFKQNLREVFPFKKPKIREIFGTLVIWIGTLIASAFVSLILAFFFPKQMAHISNQFSDLFSSAPFFISAFITAVMPAFCEEAFNRGLILSNLRSIKREWVLILLMGMLFGIFHLDVYRFLPTAILGVSLTYIMLKTNNLWLPILFHFTNNLFALIIVVFNSDKTVTNGLSQSDITLAIAGFLVFFAFVPILLFVGRMLLKPKLSEDKKRLPIMIIAIVLSVCLFVSGIILITLQSEKLKVPKPEENRPPISQSV